MAKLFCWYAPRTSRCTRYLLGRHRPTPLTPHYVPCLQDIVDRKHRVQDTRTGIIVDRALAGLTAADLTHGEDDAEASSGGPDDGQRCAEDEPSDAHAAQSRVSGVDAACRHTVAALSEVLGVAPGRVLERVQGLAYLESLLTAPARRRKCCCTGPRTTEDGTSPEAAHCHCSCHETDGQAGHGGDEAICCAAP